MEIKIVPSHTKSIEGRVVTGIFAVHGVVDYVGDRSIPGSFTKTIKEMLPARKVKYLWSHNMDFGAAGPPVAVIQGLKELTREELPPEMLEQYPEATGGVEVTRKYLDTQRGEEVYQGILEGAITEQSYGYDPVKVNWVDLPGGSNGEKGKIRELVENKLYEVSDVLWGANPATQASKLWLPSGEQGVAHIKAVLEAMLEHHKAGARHSSSDTKLLNAIHKAVITLGCTTCKGSTEDDEDKDEGKSSEEAPEVKGAAVSSEALHTLRWALAELELA